MLVIRQLDAMTPRRRNDAATLVIRQLVLLTILIFGRNWTVDGRDVSRSRTLTDHKHRCSVAASLRHRGVVASS
jgi:hypothetical protein